MKKLTLSLLCIASLSFATTFEDGVDAFESKDYKTALKVLHISEYLNSVSRIT